MTHICAKVNGSSVCLEGTVQSTTNDIPSEYNKYIKIIPSEIRKDNKYKQCTDANCDHFAR